MTAIFLSQNGVAYPAEVTDPFFEAGIEIEYPNNTRDRDENVYRSEYLVKTMICGDQYRWCNSDETERCTNWTGSRGLKIAATDEEKNGLGWNTVKKATAVRLSRAGILGIANSVVYMNTGGKLT